MYNNLIDIHSILSQTKSLVIEAKDYIYQELGRVGSNEIEEKELNSLVSYVDKNTEILLVKGLLEILPQAGLITEEDTEDDHNQDFTWVIDPLDGTTNFLHQIPYFSVSVALMYKGEIILGIVHEVTRDEQFSAIKNEGAFLNNKKISVTESASSKDILIATGFPYENDYSVEKHFETLKYFLMNTRGMRRLGSAATDLCYVAAGRLGGYYECSLNAWDVAAGALIVQEAGGSVTDFNGGQNWLFGKTILACAPQYFDEFYTCLEAMRS
jgi:myo-inositol-1(or 4)-monophosphatase